jgi:enoyl-[acyl-carrier protein] reductase I
MKNGIIEGMVSTPTQLLAGKRGVIMGVANERSIAWGIALAAHNAGAELAFSYQNDVLLKRLEPLAAELNCKRIFQCDASETGSIEGFFTKISEEWPSIDFVVHSIAASDKDELKGRYVDTSFGNFSRAINISCFSFTSIAKEAEKLMPNGGSLVTLSYYGAEKYIPNYNVMGVAKAALECSVKYIATDLGPKGIRVNAISAGPMRTLAATGINNFKAMLKIHESVAPMRRNTTMEDVSGCALYLLSELGQGTTGETIHVDCGYNIIGMTVANVEY